MKIDFTKLGRQKVIVLDNEIGLKVYLVNGGASIYKIEFDGKVMTLSPSSFNDFFRSSLYYGKTIGPVVNRIKDGKVNINNIEYQMDKNEGNNTLHSGAFGLSNYNFSFAGQIRNDKVYAINYICKTKKMKNGLPGNVTYQITYGIYPKENKLTILYTIRSDADTVMNVTNHSYFCLGDADINNLYLTIPAHKYIETSKDELLPLKVNIIDGVLDFQKSKRIVKDINDGSIQNHRSKGYDHCFLLDKGNKDIVLENKDYKLIITSDFDSVQIYSDNYEDGINMLTTNEKKS